MFLGCWGTAGPLLGCPKTGNRGSEPTSVWIQMLSVSACVFYVIYLHVRQWMINLTECITSINGNFLLTTPVFAAMLLWPGMVMYADMCEHVCLCGHINK